MNTTMPKTGLYIYVQNADGTVSGKGLYWDLDELTARKEAERLHQANQKLTCRFITGGKEIFKI